MEGYKCHWCEYRHGGCPNGGITPYCKEFKIGGCYSCKYYHGQYGELNDKEIDQWFRRGCEIYFPSALSCDKRKRMSRKRKKRLKKMRLWRR